MTEQPSKIHSNENRILRKLDVLPAVPMVVQEILEVLNKRDASVSDVSNALARDPGLTGRLVAASNAAFFSGFRPIYTIEEAVMRLGLNRVRTTALAVLIGTRFNPRRCPPFNTKYYWFEAMKAADCANKLAKLLPLGGVGHAAYLCGLLHNIGLLVNAYAFPEPMQKVLEAKLDRPALSLAELERQHLGFDHHQSGAELLRRWRMPAAVVAAVEHYPDPESATEFKMLVRLTQFAVTWAQSSFRVRPSTRLAIAEDKLRSVGESCQRERDQMETLAFMLCSAA
ncbi:hypothetical protein CAI21_01845 [Alkalilimnicola ehrlichii]|uniref:HDOD domain-containing protein n=1 Tax=Alkalilimnicola ehrlichii TaxID=351052 RepID=A0A3E0X146_9GAMM|nr:HDOD domain-containing protein [Alkalilimnicola ehrlichii]RFA31384.1 hypothetical protein CAI21_01845 [Alkalilimnicola ehrlichii]RFA39341.1 hypothetical protein CAL65_00555 [Alkalilimnicola ehrlichii]